MEVILTEDMSNLGRAGQVVKVRPGYGRNYLIPQQKALLANSKNLKALEAQKRMIGAHKSRLIGAAEGVATQLKDVHLSFHAAVGENDKLFGSITKLDLLEALAKSGITIDKHQLELEHPLKTLGDHEVPVHLHSEVTVNIKVSVLAKEE